MKKGFTLIELLAVIVILAIISLIATPIILGIINDAREESNERSVELYASAVRNGIAAYQLRTGNEVLPDTYTKETLPFEVEYDGKVECTSIIISDDNKVSLTGCKVNNGEKEYSYGDTLGQENNSDDVTKLCRPSNSNQVTTGNVPSGNYQYGDEYICNLGDGVDRIFFVLENGDNISLIMNENLDYDKVEWKDVQTILKDKTKDWSDLDETQINLPTANQIAKAVGYPDFDSSEYNGIDYSFNYMPAWLGSSQGDSYWTQSKYYFDSAMKWIVIHDKEYEGGILMTVVEDYKAHGVRPVITISTSEIQ